MVAGEPFRMLVDPLATGHCDQWLDLPETSRAGDAAALLDLLFGTDDTLDLVVLRVGTVRHGTASRRLLRGGAKGIDDAAGQTLPGHPRYELIDWRCPVCQTLVWRIHADPRRPPECPEGCGPMGMRRTG
ncbi:hypothetical protein [Dactylosporangium sp. NPDC000521]|uniref:hypothetical protein n=1 Tax=Dactylosporangium sp. NPDC000521 TaxID=3363975 RepID=UPI00367ED90C